VFSSDSKRVAYAAERGKEQFVVVDGVESKGFESVLKRTPVFSPDNKRVLYAAQQGGHWALVLDGEACFECDSFVMGGRILFDTPSSFHALIRRGVQFLRVEARIGSADPQASPRGEVTRGARGE